jgi:TonB family protein
VVSSGHFVHEVHRPVRWNTFVAGLALNAIFVLVVTLVATHLDHGVVAREVETSHFVKLVAPIYTPSIEQASTISPPIREVHQLAKLRTPRFVAPLPKIELPKPQRVETAKDAPNPVQLQPLRPDEVEMAVSPSPSAAPTTSPRPEIRTNVFASAPSESATVRAPERKVQTGGFGDPDGAAGHGDPKRDTLAMVAIGSFTSPAGPGNANGTAGSYGVSGSVRSSGFSSEVAYAAPAQVRAIASSGFGTPVRQVSDVSVQQIASTSRLEPVEIIYKPRPAYTVEARRLRVEGEVLLDVVFAANGSLRVNRVVKGLGYGLDDMALQAAQNIKFKPARRDGQPYDCAALVHMVFELTK